MFNQCILNQAVKLPFLSSNRTTGLTTFSGVIVLVDGVLAQSLPVISYSEIGTGMYTLNISPNTTGIWTILIEGTLIQIEVVTRNIFTILRNIEDEALGSWTWNKSSGVLTALRQDGSPLATYTVTDTVESATKEKTS